MKGRRAANDRRERSRGNAGDRDAVTKHNGRGLTDSEQRWLMEQIEGHGKQAAGDGDRERHPALTQRQAGRSRAPRTPDQREGNRQGTPASPIAPELLPEPRPQADDPSEATRSGEAARPDEAARDSFWKFG